MDTIADTVIIESSYCAKKVPHDDVLNFSGIGIAFWRLRCALEIYAELEVFPTVHLESGSADCTRCYCCKVIYTIDVRVIDAHIVHAVVALMIYFRDNIVVKLEKPVLSVTSIV